MSDPMRIMIMRLVLNQFLGLLRDKKYDELEAEILSGIKGLNEASDPPESGNE